MTRRAVSVLGAIAIAGVLVGASFALPRALTPALAAGAPAAPITTAAPAPSIPPDVQLQLQAMPPGTVIVPCNPSVSVLPEGVRPDTPTGFAEAHPGFRYLSHGYCADDPNATPIPMDLPLVDPTP